MAYASYMNPSHPGTDGEEISETPTMIAGSAAEAPTGSSAGEEPVVGTGTNNLKEEP
jgi:hypothetical protein